MVLSRKQVRKRGQRRDPNDLQGRAPSDTDSALEDSDSESGTEGEEEDSESDHQPEEAESARPKRKGNIAIF